MIVDTSALAAILFLDSEAALYTQMIHSARQVQISPGNFLELSLVIESPAGPEASRQSSDMFLRRAGIVVEDV
jgi:ribonuclease VapC